MRISRISENLRVIQNEIASLAVEDLQTGPLEEPFNHTDVVALQRMKASVDHMRQVLWSYIDYAHTQTRESRAFQAARVARTTHILRYACQGLEMREGPGHEVPESLFEQLTELAFTTVSRHMGSVGMDATSPAFAETEEPVAQLAAD